MVSRRPRIIISLHRLPHTDTVERQERCGETAYRPSGTVPHSLTCSQLPLPITVRSFPLRSDGPNLFPPVFPDSALRSNLHRSFSLSNGCYWSLCLCIIHRRPPSDLGRPFCHPTDNIHSQAKVHFWCILLCFWPVLCTWRRKRSSRTLCIELSTTTVKETAWPRTRRMILEQFNDCSSYWKLCR